MTERDRVENQLRDCYALASSDVRTHGDIARGMGMTMRTAEAAARSLGIEVETIKSEYEWE